MLVDIGFRPLGEADLGLLVRWFGDPMIARWWDELATPGAVRAKFGPRIAGEEAVEVFVVEIDGAPAGMVQCYRHADFPETDEVVGVPDAVGIDYLLAEGFRGRGLAGPVLAAFAESALARHPGARVCVATPDVENAASCKALVSAGFEWSHDSYPPTGRAEAVYVRDRD